MEPNAENPAVTFLRDQCERYNNTMRRLEAQLKGVQEKLIETKAKYSATKEALDAILEQTNQNSPKIDG